MNRSALVAGEVPAAVVTETRTVPAACGGAIAFSLVPETSVTVPDAVPPNFTVAPGTNPLPSIVTTVPPAVEPPVGLRLEIRGAPYA